MSERGDRERDSRPIVKKENDLPDSFGKGEERELEDDYTVLQRMKKSFDKSPLSGLYKCLDGSKRLKMDLLASAYVRKNIDPCPEKELICTDCQFQLRDPVQSLLSTQGHHVFCKSCIIPGMESTASCPICQKTCTIQKVKGVWIKSPIMDLKQSFLHAKIGCTDKFNLQNYHSHQLECQYKLTEEELQQVQPDPCYVTQLLKALSIKSLHHLIPKILSAEKESINIRTVNKEAPLLVALMNGCSLETLNVLLEAGAQVTGLCDWSQNALHFALPLKYPLSVIKNLLQYDKEMVQQRNKYGVTPLMCALVHECSIEVFREVVKAGADLTVLDDSLRTHLHCAAEGGCCKEILEEILRLKPDSISHKDKWGCIPLHYATDEWTVKTLLEAGSDTGARDNEGNTPLQWALHKKELTDSTLKLYVGHMSTEQ